MIKMGKSASFDPYKSIIAEFIQTGNGSFSQSIIRQPAQSFYPSVFRANAAAPPLPVTFFMFHSVNQLHFPLRIGTICMKHYSDRTRAS
ncbi:MAG: hypothetical protein VB062_08610 [Christensenella sp.]|nr:hypothetical protein [Christensenella sp.]